MNKLIKNLSFRFTVFDNGMIYPSMWFLPEEISNVLNYWSNQYTTSQSVLQLINEIQSLNNLPLPNNEIITHNENHIYIKEKEQLIFDVEYISGLKPIVISLSDSIYLFQRYYDWLLKYENCKIPGLIPKSLHNTHITVPISAVKDEYLRKISEHE